MAKKRDTVKADEDGSTGGDSTGGMADESNGSSQAARFTVRTPRAAFAGMRAGVMFFQGVGYTEDPAKAAELRKLGYAVSERT